MSQVDRTAGGSNPVRNIDQSSRFYGSPYYNTCPYEIPRLQFGPCFSGETGPKACTAPSEMHTVARITQGYATIQITSRAVRLAQ